MRYAPQFQPSQSPCAPIAQPSRNGLCPVLGRPVMGQTQMNPRSESCAFLATPVPFWESRIGPPSRLQHVNVPSCPRSSLRLKPSGLSLPPHVLTVHRSHGDKRRKARALWARSFRAARGGGATAPGGTRTDRAALGQTRAGG